MSETADIAVIGLAVMGQNLILNMNDHGFVVCAYNRTVSKVDEFLQGPAKGTKIVGANSIEDMISKLKKPRRIMLMVRAGSAVDDFINQLLPHLSSGDIIIDGGNSEYVDTNRRCAELRKKGFFYIGSGVSGGEEGARYGPSIMPGGHIEAWPHVKPIFQGIAAKVGDEDCCDWVGTDGAGHFVKMVHNGIEYGDMQIIAEAYSLMEQIGGMSYDQMADVFDRWNGGELESFLIEITAAILRYRDPQTGQHLVPLIRDSAGQKGTGKWTGIAALQFDVPMTLVAESVFARQLSAMKDDRMAASEVLAGHALDTKQKMTQNELQAFIDDLKSALYAAKIISYAQGYMLFRSAAEQFNWDLNMGSIALMWRGGCIIRSRFLGNIRDAFHRQPDLRNLMLDGFFSQVLGKTIVCAIGN